MKTIQTTVYQFDELSDDAKESAIQNLSCINVDFEWWECTYEDAENIGIKLTSFDIESFCNGEFILSANEIALNISNNHGENCETFKTSELFMEKWQPLFDNYMSTEEGEEELIDCENEYLESMLEDYRIILSNEYDYQTSEEAIIETIKVNEYDFLDNGKMF